MTPVQMIIADLQKAGWPVLVGEAAKWLEAEKQYTIDISIAAFNDGYENGDWRHERHNDEMATALGKELHKNATT